MDNYNFNNGSTNIYLNENFDMLNELADRERTILFIDSNVFTLHLPKFAGWRSVIIPSGESSKQQATINAIVEQLISYEADRTSLFVGIGGGVVTDITGFVASTYMRGVKFGFIPTTLLAMVDASLGGKNGIDVGPYKNLLGIVNQPSFILYDLNFLTTLSKNEWVNGMAEVIKHASIKKKSMFESLEHHNLDSIMTSGVLLNGLISMNVKIKMAVVQNDELETGERKLLNFGHTLGHAIETISKIPHGQAISIGMVMAAKFSKKISGFPDEEFQRLRTLLQKYNLPVKTDLPLSDILHLVKLDKKRRGDYLDLILLKSIGNAEIHKIAFNDLENFND